MKKLLAAEAAAVVAALFAPIMSASAHDVWITIAGEPAGRRAIVHYGHPGDRPPAFADKVVDLVAITASDRKSLRDGLEAARVDGIAIAQSKAFANERPALLAARYDNGFWVKNADGTYRNATRRLVPDATESLWSGKFAKAITGVDAPWQSVVGHELEIVPLSDPDRTKPGQKLQVKVLFRGQPLAGAEVERGDGIKPVPEKEIPRFKTDSVGVATVPIAKAGPQLLVIDYKLTPSLTPDQANADMFNATLWFLLPQ